MRLPVVLVVCSLLLSEPFVAEAKKSAPPRCAPLGQVDLVANRPAAPSDLTNATNATEALSVHPTLLLYTLGAPEPTITTKLAIEFANCSIIAIPVSSAPTVSAGEQSVPDKSKSSAGNPNQKNAPVAKEQSANQKADAKAISGNEAVSKTAAAAGAASKAATAAKIAANAVAAADTARKSAAAATASKSKSAQTLVTKAAAAEKKLSKAVADSETASNAAAKAALEAKAAANSGPAAASSKPSQAAAAPADGTAGNSDKPLQSVVYLGPNTDTSSETALYPPNLSQALARSHTLCSSNTLIFTYLVEEAQLDRTLIGETRTRIKVVGYLYNCDRQVIGVFEGEDNKRELTNPGLAAFKYIGIAVALKPRFQSVALTTTAPLVTSFFDRTSNQQVLLADGAQRAFLHMVRDDLCVKNRRVCRDVTQP